MSASRAWIGGRRSLHGRDPIVSARLRRAPLLIAVFVLGTLACGGLRRGASVAEPPPRAPIVPHDGTPGALAAGGHDEAEIDALVGTIGGSIAACANGRHGAVTIDVTFGSDGRARDEAIASGEFQGGGSITDTLEAGCMLAVAHEGTVAPFTGEDRHVLLSFHF